MLKMVHGTCSEQLLWPMVRFAQQSGNDAVCRAILMKHLGEPNTPNVLEVCRENDGTTTNRRDVGKHAQTVVRLLGLSGDKMTPAMLVKEWRAKPDNAPQWYEHRGFVVRVHFLFVAHSILYHSVKDNPPGKDGLSTDDCERIIVALLLEGIVKANPKWTPYE
jgi:hypothetical protein